MMGEVTAGGPRIGRDTGALELWREVYDLAGRIWQLAPWTFMDETDLFGVEEPLTKQLGFISVMGALGEHHAVAVYRGAKGLYDFLALENASGDLAPSRFLDMPQVQLSFEKRSALEPEDMALLTRLGPSGMKWEAWPLVRTYRAACMPWFAEPDELRLLSAALTQLLEMAPRIEADPTSLRPPKGPGVLVRARCGEESASWGESFVVVAAPEPDRISVRIDPDLIEEVRELPESDGVLEVDCFRTETVIAEPGKRPYFPYALLMCDADSGLVVHADLLDPTPSIVSMWGTAPEMVTRQFVSLGGIPREVRVKDALLAQLLELIAPGLGFTVAQARRLPSLDRAKASLLQNLGGPGKRKKVGRKPKKR